jgi:PTH1 family peptidyl-tRNA hydrolase
VLKLKLKKLKALKRNNLLKDLFLFTRVGIFPALLFLCEMKYLIAGLGNIGAEYENTRHNIGFKVLDKLAQQEGFSFSTERLAMKTEWKYKGRIYILIKPTTYMNLSGNAVRYWLNHEKIQPENLLVITDDIALPFGKIRIRAKGSAGGHNGLKNISEVLANENYPRLRFGVGSEFSKGRQVDYVLGKWDAEEEKILPERIDIVVEAIKAFGTIGLERTMNFYNSK